MCDAKKLAEEQDPPRDDSPEESEETSTAARFIKVDDKKPEGYEGSCLRPTGMCDLGGCCDVCWYSPEHPRFSKKK